LSPDLKLEKEASMSPVGKNIPGRENSLYKGPQAGRNERRAECYLPGDHNPQDSEDSLARKRIVLLAFLNG
jgi:hypothetical protein